MEEGFAKRHRWRFRVLARILLEEMAEALRRAGYVAWAPG